MSAELLGARLRVLELHRAIEECLHSLPEDAALGPTLYYCSALACVAEGLGGRAREACSSLEEEMAVRTREG